MTDFKNLFKLIFKRFGIWILLLTLLIGTINGVQTKYSLENDSRQLKNSVEEMSKDLGQKMEVQGKITKDYIKKADDIAKKYAKKYNIKSTEEINQMADDEFHAYNQKQESQYDSRFWEIESYYRTYESIKETSEDGDLGASKYIFNMNFAIAILLGLIAMVLTSIDQSLPYYDFSLMLPWKKKDEVWMKATIVFILGSAIFLINLLINIFMIKASNLSLLVNIGSLGDSILKSILIMLATSILSVSTGMIAGNFVGHIGLMIIAVGSIELIMISLDLIFNIISPAFEKSFMDAFINLRESAPQLLKPFLSLVHLEMNYQSIGGFLIIAIIWALLAYLVNGKISSEKSGYMIMSKPVGIFAKIIGILSLTSILYVIGSAAITGDGSNFISLIIYILALLLSAKLFDILFKIRLKF